MRERNKKLDRTNIKSIKIQNKNNFGGKKRKFYNEAHIRRLLFIKFNK